VGTPDSDSAAGLFGSLRRLLGTAAEVVRVRLALLSTEVELEKQRLLEGLFWGAIALVFLSAGIAMTCGFVLMLMWEGYRLAALGVLALCLLLAGALLLQFSRHRLSSPGGMFKASVAELARDQSHLAG
jgi:uncharacterized membrane protein YqjE